MEIEYQVQLTNLITEKKKNLRILTVQGNNKAAAIAALKTCQEVSYTAKITIQDLDIMVYYIEYLEFVVLIINTHTEIEASIPGHKQ